MQEIKSVAFFSFQVSRLKWGGNSF